MSGDLTNFENPSDSSPSLFRAGAGSDAGLNIWSFSSDSTVTFTAGGQAFAGSATWNLDSNEYADTVAGMTSGELYFPADDASDLSSETLIGEYRVIPAPAGLALVGAAGPVAGRPRR